MGRNKGICTLCGAGGKVTFEHVPPEKSGNDCGVTMFSLEEWLARDRATGRIPGGVPQPAGMGLLALCRACNVDLLGGHYVPAFNDFVEAGRQMLASFQERFDEMDARDRATGVIVRFLCVNRLAVAKQIVAMILVTSGRDIVRAHPALEQFVRTPDAREVPANYRLFLALTPGPAARTTGVSVRVDLNTGAETIYAEVVFPPFAYGVTFNGTAMYSLAADEITHWAAAEYGSVAEEELRLPFGFTHTVFPGDLRTIAQIRRQEQENESDT